MPIPDYQTVMLPLLRFAEDSVEHSSREAADRLADHFTLTEAERLELLPSGIQPTFVSRVGWATTYMKKALLLESTRRSHFKITDRGLQLLATNPVTINVKVLRQYEEFVEFQGKRNVENGSHDTAQVTLASPPKESELTPDESIENAYQMVRGNLAAELLQQIMSCSPAFFERLVIDLLIRMGYGGSLKDAGQAVGKSGDGGIDGIIKEDRLGLDVIYIQAKRWEGTVGSPEIQKFVGALHGQRARKGIFITTSQFTADAQRYVATIENKVVLIDGDTLANYMIDFNIGVSVKQSYEIKRLDSDYFNG